MNKAFIVQLFILVFSSLVLFGQENQYISNSVSATPSSGSFLKRYPTFPAPEEFENCAFISSDSEGRHLGKIVENKCSHLYVDIDDKGNERYDGEALFLTNIYCELNGYQFIFEDVMCGTRTVGLKSSDFNSPNVPKISNSFASNCLDEDYRLMTFSDAEVFESGDKNRLRYIKRGGVKNKAAN